MKNRIVFEKSSNKFAAIKIVEAKMEKFRKKGWEPQGKPTIQEFDGYFYIIQAMVKK